MIERVQGHGAVEETPIGLVPGKGGIDFDGLGLSRSEQEALLRVDSDEWVPEVAELRTFFDRFGDRIPEALVRSLDNLSEALTAARA